MRVYNFSAGPAVLPEEVLKEAAAEMLDYKGTGMSVMEMSHRSKAYQAIIDEAEADLRDLMNIPDNYKVLFLQGGASQQFAMIPMNLMKNGKAVLFLDFHRLSVQGHAVCLRPRGNPHAKRHFFLAFDDKANAVAEGIKRFLAHRKMLVSDG